jgi:endonuclease III
MPSVKRPATTASPARASPRTQRTTAKAESPPASRGQELEIGHAPEPFYPSTPITPQSKRIKIEPRTPITPAKAYELSTESPSKMSPAKLRMLESLGSSPFPHFVHPTPEECRAVDAALVNVHGNRVRPKEMNLNALGANCGEVPSVLDALVRTILSQNTNNKNSSTAKQSLDKTFGPGNFEAVRAAPLEEVVDALRCGGLANIKGGRIKQILDEVYEKYGTLSLDHLHGVSDDEAKRELMAFDGVGPKTASCVLLFCLRRDSFAVDTHVVSPLSCFDIVSNHESAGMDPSQRKSGTSVCTSGRTGTGRSQVFPAYAHHHSRTKM